MEESFWERKGIKGAFAWIAIDIIALVLFAVTGFDRELISLNWTLILIMVINIDRIVIPLANLPEPPKIFTFLVGIIPAGMLIAYFVSFKTSTPENQIKTGLVLLATLILWNAANIGWGIFEKKKQNKKSGL